MTSSSTQIGAGSASPWTDGSALFSRRWPDGTPRFDRAGEPFRSPRMRAVAKALDIALCHYYGIPQNNSMRVSE